MKTTDHCHDTYLDAITWTQDRRDAEIRGYCEQMTALYDRTRPELIDCIIREMRALRMASRDKAMETIV